MKKLLYSIAFLPVLLIAQHKVSGVFSPATEFTYAFLYQTTPSGVIYINRSKVETDGNFSIVLDSSIVTPGIYKIVYGLPPEDNNFDFIYDGKEDVALSFDFEKGLEFIESNENKLWSSYTKSMELVNNAISNFYSKESTDEEAFKDIFKTLKETQDAYENASKGTLALTFIKANRPYIPTGFEDVSTYSKNLKQTFLQQVDFENPLLQSSDFLTDRVMAYVFGMSSNNNESYKKDIDHLVELMSKTNAIVKIALLQKIWQKFVDSNNEAMANYITDTYLLNLAKEAGYTQLIEILTLYKTNSIGNKAPNFEIQNFENGESTVLYDLKDANRYLIIFWSSSCSHCLEELPKVNTIIPENTKVIAIGIEDDAENWQKEIKNYPNFIHVLGLEKWNNTIVKAYNINATPSYILLDRNKIIIAKPYDLEDLKEIILK
jgi:thiol-disulfide isomerase/thioredoxin